MAEGGPHLVLVGMMGSGKSTVGRAVAERSGRVFLDSDDEVEESTGRTVKEIFEADGEAAFRGEEARVLRDALDRTEPVVVAAAGGVVLDERNRARLRDHVVVWLDARPEQLAERAARGDHRPLLGDDPEAALRRLDGERRPLYAEVADATVGVGDRPVDEVIEAVLVALTTSGVGTATKSGEGGG